MNITHQGISARATSTVAGATTPWKRHPARPHLKTHQLALLVHLDDERRLARAAAAAGLTQPAASKMLRQIEETLDVKLFERHARGVAPTCYGEIIVRQARLALSALGLAQDEVAALKAGRSGTVAIGTVIDPGTNLVPIAIAKIKQCHPGMMVHVESDSSRKLVLRLQQGHLDMVVGRLLDAEIAGEFAYEPLASDEPHSVIAGAPHPLAGSADLRLEDLIGQPWILPPSGSLIRERLTGMFLSHNLPQPGNIIETASLPVITCLLEQSEMVVALPEESVRSYCTAGILTVLFHNLPVNIGGFGLITRRSGDLSPGARLMLGALRETAGRLYPPARRPGLNFGMSQ